MKKDGQNLESVEQHRGGESVAEVELERFVAQLKTEKVRMKRVREELETFLVLSCAVFAATLVWFLYWIIYDVTVWNKSFLQVNPVNYFGLLAMVGLIVFEAKITIHRTPKLLVEGAKLGKVMPLLLRSGEYSHNVDYFGRPSGVKEIPGKCIGCSGIINCDSGSDKAKRNVSETITQDSKF